jgi:hypothetical protein
VRVLPKLFRKHGYQLLIVYTFHYFALGMASIQSRCRGRFRKKSWINRLEKVITSTKDRFSEHSDHGYCAVDTISSPVEVGAEIEVQTDQNRTVRPILIDLQAAADADTHTAIEGSDSDSWRDGRRVVDLAVLADGLNACQLCSQPLQLSNCVGEHRKGLGGYVLVQCGYTECRHVNSVALGETHGNFHAWDVNTKLASGMCVYKFYFCI